MQSKFRGWIIAAVIVALLALIGSCNNDSSSNTGSGSYRCNNCGGDGWDSANSSSCVWCGGDGRTSWNP